MLTNRRFLAPALAGLLAMTTTASASTPAHLENLVGVRAAGGETQMLDRGYEIVRSDPSGSDRKMYWRQRGSGECVLVRVSNGRYASVDATAKSECSESAGSSLPGGSPEGGFETVCGVMVDERSYRYKCVVSGARPGKQGGKTVLRYPDQTVRLEWRKGDSVRVTLEGMYPETTKFSKSEGETRFRLNDRTYFYVSDRERARMEVRDFRQD
jgi:hypothetical protein